jgi:hypothetical protein
MPVDWALENILFACILATKKVMFMFLCFFELASIFFLLARFGRKTD